VAAQEVVNNKTGAGSWFGLATAAATAVIVGFASTILIIMEAARTVGATPSQQASWAASLCFGMAITSLVLSYLHRMPMVTAWSTPGAALIATSTSGVAYENALGAFVVAGLLMALTAFIKPLARAIERIPGPIAAAMLAGVLVRYCLGVPGAAQAMPLAVLPLIVLYFALRAAYPLLAVPVAVAGGIVAALLMGNLGGACCTLAITWLEWTTPRFDAAAIIGLGVPLFLVTMASQNLPGFAVLKASGYEPPVQSALAVTGLWSAIAAPFGSHAVNMAAITASLVTGPECHPDPKKRWLMAWPYFAMYAAIGLFAASFIGVLGALPKPLITAIAGLALFGPLFGSASAMFKEQGAVEAALVTFVVTASGLSVDLAAGGLLIKGIGSAFWGLAAGLLIYGARKAFSRT
jgi:benzoate membrane transport protein